MNGDVEVVLHVGVILPHGRLRIASASLVDFDDVVECGVEKFRVDAFVVGAASTGTSVDEEDGNASRVAPSIVPEMDSRIYLKKVAAVHIFDVRTHQLVFRKPVGISSVPRSTTDTTDSTHERDQGEKREVRGRSALWMWVLTLILN